MTQFIVFIVFLANQWGARDSEVFGARPRSHLQRAESPMTRALHSTSKTEVDCVAVKLSPEQISICSPSNLSQMDEQFYIQHRKAEARTGESDMWVSWLLIFPSCHPCMKKQPLFSGLTVKPKCMAGAHLVSIQSPFKVGFATLWEQRSLIFHNDLEKSRLSRGESNNIKQRLMGQTGTQPEMKQTDPIMETIHNLIKCRPEKVNKEIRELWHNNEYEEKP